MTSLKLTNRQAIPSDAHFSSDRDFFRNIYYVTRLNFIAFIVETLITKNNETCHRILFVLAPIF